MPEHDKLGPGTVPHEEVYVVLEGHAVFTVAGDEVDAPRGTTVFVRDPAAKRSALAKEAGTTVLAVAGRRGEAWQPTPGELMQGFWPLYQEKDYEGALGALEDVFETYPENALALFNSACMESLLGRSDEALGHLEAALGRWPDLREQARTDEDLAPLRDDPRFQQLVA